MAKVIPGDWQAQESLPGGMRAERETLERLAQQLPDDWTVFHGVHWARSGQRYTVFGEIDFAILPPGGRLLVIEQKMGRIDVRDGRLMKAYSLGEKGIGEQMERNLDALRGKFRDQYGDIPLQIDYVLYLPGYRVQDMHALQLDRSRIVDASRKAHLADVLLTIADELPDDPEQCARITEFLVGVLDLEPDVGAFIEAGETSYRQLSSGLVAFGDALALSPPRLRIRGCAGSGKTQFAQHRYARAIAAGRRPLYLCFNRPLAERLAALFPQAKAGLPQGMVATLDHVARAFCEAQGRLAPSTPGESPDFGAIRALAASLPVPEDWQYDLLIVDEGQDLDDAAASLAQRFLKPGGELLWLEDPHQQLHGRQPPALEVPATLRLQRDFRSPWQACELMQLLLQLDPPVVPSNPVPGLPPVVHNYASPEAQDTMIERAVRELLDQGFRWSQIALVSFRGLNGGDPSRYAAVDTIGEWTLRRFTGNYDAARNQVYTPGDLLFDSIYRFKGRQAPAVVFCDIDFDALDDTVINRLYCGMTRATTVLHLVMTKRAEALLMARVPGYR